MGKEWAGNKKEPPDKTTLLFLLYPTHFPLQYFPTHKQQKLLHPQLGEIFNSKHGWAKFNNDFAQAELGKQDIVALHRLLCSTFTPLQKACSPLKTCYLTMMLSSIRGVVTLSPYSTARMIYPPSRIIHNPKVCLLRVSKCRQNSASEKKTAFPSPYSTVYREKKSNFGLLQCLNHSPAAHNNVWNGAGQNQRITNTLDWQFTAPTVEPRGQEINAAFTYIRWSSPGYGQVWVSLSITNGVGRTNYSKLL